MLIRKPLIAYNTDDPGGATPPEPAAEPAAPAEPQPGPWAADAAAYFGENQEAIAAFDRYMREKQQPYLTQLEQESAPARELYKDLISNPQETLAEVMAELFGDEQPDLVERFGSIWDAPEPAEPTEPAATTEAAPEDDDVIEWARQKREAEREAEAIKAGEEAYAEVLAELRTAHPDLTDADMELIHPFMASAPDPETAYAGYQTFKAQFAATHGATPADPVDAPAPPAVLGSEGTVAATPPVAKDYKNIDEAMDDWFAERRAAAPPVVGSA